MLWVEVKLAAVTVASCSPSSVLETPNKLYAWPLTRAMTDQVKSFPCQNFGDPVGKLAAKSPGSQTMPVSHGDTIKRSKSTKKKKKKTNWIDMDCELPEDMRPEEGARRSLNGPGAATQDLVWPRR